MKKAVAILLTALMLFSFFQGALGENVVKADETYQWVQTNNGLFDRTVTMLAIDPKNPQVIYAGTNGAGVFKSKDGGINWTEINDGLKSSEVKFLAVDPVNTQIIYVSTSSFNGGLFKSTNSGESWIQTGLTNNDIEYIIIDHKNPQMLYAIASPGVGVFKSTDGGNSWTRINEEGEIVSGLSGELVYSIAMDPIDANIIYAGTSKESLFSKGIFFKSINGGKDWVKLDTGLKCDRVSAITVDPLNSNIIYVGTRVDGVFKTLDGGQRWEKVSNGLTGTGAWINCFAINSKNSNIIYTGTQDGVYKSMDGGKSWNAIKNIALPHLTSEGHNFYEDIIFITIDPSNPEIIYVGKNGYCGVYKSTDGGNNWAQINKGFTYKYISVTSLTIDPTNTKILYTAIGNGHLFKSTDSGQSWIQIASISNYIYSLVSDPRNTQVIYAGTGMDGLFKSLDGGLSWTQTTLKSSSVNSIVFDPKDPQVIYTSGDNGVFRSVDGGISWTPVNAGSTVNFVAINPSDTQIIYISRGPLIRSSDGGKNWSMCVITQTGVSSIAFDPVNSQCIYAGTRSGTLIKSIDGGLNWHEFGSVGSGIEFITIEPQNTQNILVGTFNKGVLKSTDGGLNWTAINNGLASLYIKSLIVDPTNAQIIYIGTDEGVFKMTTINNFKITSSADPGGSISPSGTITVNSGESKTFTITPNSGYKISLVKVDGISKGSLSSYTFTNITSDHTISVTFEKEITQTIIVLKIGNTTFTVNGVSNTLDSPPVIKNNRTLLPIRAIIEALGGSVSWDATEKKVTVTLGSTTIELWIGKLIAKINSVDTPIDSTNSKVVPEIINGRTMLPLRFVTENLGAKVDWEPSTQTITITYPGS